MENWYLSTISKAMDIKYHHYFSYLEVISMKNSQPADSIPTHCCATNSSSPLPSE